MFDHQFVRLPRRAVVAMVAAGAVAHAVAVATPAAGHGIGEDAVGRSVPDFVPIGMEHMLLGWDHLLFIVAVVWLAGRPGRAAKFISLFALGHSTTLIIATLAEWQINPELVDVVIALSIAYVGVVGARGKPYNWRLFGVGVFGFGLVHGLGLSTRFQDLGLPDEGLLARLIAFNIGIELGQLLAIAAVAVFAALILEMTGKREQVRRPQVLRGAGVGIVLVGLIAAGVLTVRSGGGDPYADLAAASPADCSIEQGQAPSVLQGRHPPQTYFAPGETFAETDFGHVVGDGFVVIRYSDSLPQDQREALQAFVDSTQGVVAGAVAEAPYAIEATTQDRTLTCAGPDAATALEFGELWLQERLG